jgi:glycerol-3-phosphate cytidylyltransferase
MRVLTIGTFDLFHVGHLELLRECNRLAGLRGVIVGVNDGDFVRRFKGRRPVNSNDERLANVRAIRFTDAAFIHLGRDYAQRDIRRFLPDIIAVGDDWQGRDYLDQLGVTQDWLDTRGIRVVYVPRTTGVSSSAVRASLG